MNMMFYPNPYAFPPLIASLTIASLGIFVWRKNTKSATNFSWFLVCLSMFIWLIGDTLLFSTHNKQMGIFFTRIVYLGVTAVPFCGIYFSASISKVRVKKYYVVAAMLLYMSAILIIFKSNLVIGELYNFYWGFYPKAQRYHWAYLLIWGTLFALGIILLWTKINQSSLFSQHQRCSKL